MREPDIEPRPVARRPPWTGVAPDAWGKTGDAVRMLEDCSVSRLGGRRLSLVGEAPRDFGGMLPCVQSSNEMCAQSSLNGVLENYGMDSALRSRFPFGRPAINGALPPLPRSRRAATCLQGCGRWRESEQYSSLHNSKKLVQYCRPTKF